MDILFLLIPLSVVLALLVVGGLAWAVWRGQFEALDAEGIAAIRQPILDEYRRQSSAYYSTSEIWDDGILDPVDTRNALAIALSAALNAPGGDPHYGVFRM